MTIRLCEFEEGRGHFMQKPGVRGESPRLVPVIAGEEFSSLLVEIDFDDIDTDYFVFLQESPWYNYLDEAVRCFFEGEGERQRLRREAQPEFSRWETLLLHGKFLGASKEMIHEIDTEPISPGNFFEVELTLEKRVDGSYFPLLTITGAEEYNDVVIRQPMSA